MNIIRTAGSTPSAGPALADQINAWVWFEQTTAVTPLGHEKPHGAPETYPFGL